MTTGSLVTTDGLDRSQSIRDSSRRRTRTSGSTRSKRLADSLPGGVVDCSIGTPCDPVPEVASRAAAAALPRRVDGVSGVGGQRRAA